MKRLILAVIMILVFAVSANATVLRWNASIGALGYELHYTDITEGTDWAVDVGDVVTTEFIGIPGHEYVFDVRAYNYIGVSGPSNGVSDTMQGYTPANNPQPNTEAVPGPPTITVE